MNKTAIKNFAIWARNKLIADVSYDARLIGITEDGIAKPLPQSFGGTQFFDIGTAEPYSISGEAVRQRDKLIEVIQQKEKDTDYKTAYQYVIEEVAYTWFKRCYEVFRSPIGQRCSWNFSKFVLFCYIQSFFRKEPLFFSFNTVYRTLFIKKPPIRTFIILDMSLLYNKCCCAKIRAENSPAKMEHVYICII